MASPQQVLGRMARSYEACGVGLAVCANKIYSPVRFPEHYKQSAYYTTTAARGD